MGPERGPEAAGRRRRRAQGQGAPTAAPEEGRGRQEAARRADVGVPRCEAAPSKKNPWQARATNPVSLGGDGKYKSIGLFPTEKEAAMAVDDYLYTRSPRKHAAFRANFPRNADGTCDVPACRPAAGRPAALEVEAAPPK